jgi:hypothetical protein
MRTSEEEEPEHRMGFISIVYGYESRLKREEFIDILQ